MSAARSPRLTGTRLLAGVAVIVVLTLAGCGGEKPVDPTVERTDANAHQLRDRLFRVQAAS